MAQTYIAAPGEDLQLLLDAIGAGRVQAQHNVDDLVVLVLNGHAGKNLQVLKKAGLSFNYASFAHKTPCSATEVGQCRYGHDGEVMFHNLVPDRELSQALVRLIDRKEFDGPELYRIVLVCCGTESWDSRHENGQMYKMRCLLSD
jgi:hypothetical protein